MEVNTWKPHPGGPSGRTVRGIAVPLDHSEDEELLVNVEHLPPLAPSGPIALLPTMWKNYGEKDGDRDVEVEGSLSDLVSWPFGRHL